MNVSDSTIIVVEPARLVAQFANNASAIHVPQVSQLLFDAWTYSYDPDGDINNKTGMNFSFYCRRLCENWPAAQPPYQTYSSWAGLDSGCSSTTDGSQKGCFGSGTGILK